MKLPKKMQWLKEHLEAQMTDKEQKLWDKYETSELDILGESGDEIFETGWELGRIEMLTEVLGFIDTLENPVYGDV